MCSENRQMYFLTVLLQHLNVYIQVHSNGLSDEDISD